MFVPRGTLRVRLASGALACIALAAVAVGWTTWVERRSAARRVHRSRPAPDEHGVVVVLGFANRGPRANRVNRFRARAAVRSATPGARTTIVCAGGAVRGTRSEASLLAAYIRDRLGWHGAIVVEEASRSTWENVRNVVPHLEQGAWIAFASNVLHAEKARAYLEIIRPDLAERLSPPSDRPGLRDIGVRVPFAIVSLWKLRTRRRAAP